MSIGLNEVTYVEKLARIAIPEQEKALFVEQLQRIVAYVEKLKELDTKDVEPTAHILPVTNVWRKDEVVPFKDTQALVTNAPETDGVFFDVPDIL